MRWLFRSSSREHAAWALLEYGCRAVVASSFNPIFRSNCVNNGIVPVELGSAAIVRIAASVGDRPAERPVTVAFHACTVATAANECWPFAIDTEARQMLLGGMHAIELTLTRRPAVEPLPPATSAERPVGKECSNT